MLCYLLVLFILYATFAITITIGLGLTRPIRVWHPLVGQRYYLAHVYLLVKKNLKITKEIPVITIKITGNSHNYWFLSRL